MSNQTPNLGDIVWRDLTVDNAESIRDFYQQVVGWKPEPVAMGDYSDFSMLAPGSGESVAGVCHARGNNADMPPQWLMYVLVGDVDAGAAKCVELGGEVVVAPRASGDGRLCVVRDPAGAMLALYQT